MFPISGEIPIFSISDWLIIKFKNDRKETKVVSLVMYHPQLICKLDVERFRVRFVSREAIDLHCIEVIDFSLLNCLLCRHNDPSETVANRLKIYFLLVWWFH